MAVAPKNLEVNMIKKWYLYYSPLRLILCSHLIKKRSHVIIEGER